MADILCRLCHTVSPAALIFLFQLWRIRTHVHAYGGAEYPSLPREPAPLSLLPPSLPVSWLLSEYDQPGRCHLHTYHTIVLHVIIIHPCMHGKQTRCLPWLKEPFAPLVMPPPFVQTRIHTPPVGSCAWMAWGDLLREVLSGPSFLF